MPVFRLFVILVLLMTPTSTLAKSRVAFIVGNSSYENAPPLPNPANDAKLVARTLEGLGFDVSQHSNLSRWEIAGELSNFLKKAEDADLTLFYFAGHGMQFEGRNYLLGTDAQLESELDIQAEALDLDQITRLLRKNSRAALIFVDACRDNPVATDFYRRTLPATRSASLRGLAELNQRFDGAMVTFSASPGQVAYDGQGAYSPFAEALAKHLPTPNIEILTLMKRVIGDVKSKTDDRQVPMISNDLSREIYLLEKAAMPVTNEAGATDARSEVERVFEAAQEIETERGWALFMNRFPQSEYHEQAMLSWERAKFAELRNTRSGVWEVRASELWNTMAQEIEDSLGLGTYVYRQLQSKLNQRGFPVGAVDGAFGQQSRQALAKFQEQYNIRARGAVTVETAQALRIRVRHNRLVPMPIYSSAEAKWFRIEYLSALEFDPRIIKAAEGLSGRRFIYGAYDGKIYLIIRLPRTVDLLGARKIAADAGGYLATITSSAENDFIYEMSINDRTLWLDCNSCNDVFGPSFGLYQPEGSREPAGGWRWVNDEPITFTNWESFSPGNFNNNDYFASFFKYRGKIGDTFHGKTWHDMPSSTHSIVIEID